LAQTFTDWEAIVVDDGSTDNTAEVIKPYLSDGRIRYHQSNHLGAAGARNVAIGLARGAFLAILDADDLWLPAKLERQVALFRDDVELGVAYTRIIVINEDGSPASCEEHLEYPLHRGWVLPALFQENFVLFSSTMIRRSVLDDVGRLDEKLPLAMDYDLLLRAAHRYRFDYVDEPLVMYRTGHANLSRREEERSVIVLGIRDRFLERNQGRQLLPPCVIRSAYAGLYLHLGVLAAPRSRIAALHWYLRALAQRPALITAWKEVIKLSLPLKVQCFMRRALRRSGRECSHVS
jgi:glycosyltransferase involved in cell wall biosynthesis